MWGKVKEAYGYLEGLTPGRAVLYKQKHGVAVGVSNFWGTPIVVLSIFVFEEFY